MTISRKSAFYLGVGSICVVLFIQAFNSFACYEHNVITFIYTTVFFLTVPLIPAFISLGLLNPLRAVGACTLFVPWLIFAYYVDCIKPYAGGGASMVYVGVLFWGTPSAILGAFITGPITRIFNIEVK